MPDVAIEVGQPFPRRLPRGREGLFPLVAGETLLVPVVLGELRDSDLHTFEHKALQVGMHRVQDVPFVLLYWKRWGCLDGSLNPYQYSEEYRTAFAEGEGNLLQIAVLEGREQIVRHNRVLGLKDEMYEYLRQAYRSCMEHYADEAEVNRAVGRVYQDFAQPDDLMRTADKKQVFRRHG